MIKNILKTAWSGATFLSRLALSKLGFGRPKLYRLVQVEDFPEDPKPLTVYVAGEGEHQWGAAMLCPCGCGDTIELNLLSQVRPRWKVDADSKRAVTLSPSVWRKKGCKSHFFVRRGRVDWC